MAHYSRLDKTVIDVAPDDHDRELEFWRGALGWPMQRVERHPEYHWTNSPDGGFRLLVQHLGDGPSGIHLDIHTDDLDAEVARLEALGARRVTRQGRWWIMEDPAGLRFCVIPESPGRLNDDNATRWE